MSAIVAAAIGVAGLFLYGFIAWFCKRLIEQIDHLTEVVSNLADKILTLNLRVKFLENKVNPSRRFEDDE